jgi:hypothetical protein
LGNMRHVWNLGFLAKKDTFMHSAAPKTLRISRKTFHSSFILTLLSATLI